MDEKVGSDTGIEVDPRALLPNPYQVRVTNLPDPALDELVESIRKNGPIEPPIVRQTPHGYQIVTGHRRVTACIRAGLKTIRCNLGVYTDEQMAVAVMEENLKRKSLNPIEEAKGYANLRDKFHYTEEKIAATYQNTRDHVAQSLRLLAFQQPIQDLVARNQLTPSHAEAIAMAPARRQLELAQTVVIKKLSVKKTTEIAKELVYREKANQQAIENIAQRLGTLDTQVADLKARISRHEPLVTWLEFHEQHHWKSESCQYNVNGLCQRFSWDSTPIRWVGRLRGIAQFKAEGNGRTNIQACGAVCALCTVYLPKDVYQLRIGATQHKS
jgi:ParB/RepB/Spo0J family partition protein